MYTIATHTITTPSSRDNTPSAASAHSSSAAPAITGRSKRSVRASIASGRISALSPRMNIKLTTLVPAMLPTANLPLLDPVRLIPLIGDPLADLLQPDLTGPTCTTAIS